MGDWWSNFNDGLNGFFAGTSVGGRNVAAPTLTADRDRSNQAISNWLAVASAQDLVDAGYISLKDSKDPTKLKQVVDSLLHPAAPRPDSDRAYYGTGNPTADGVLNALGSVGVGVSSNYGVHQGSAAPANVLAQRDIEGQADAAIAAQGDKMPSWSIPPNPSSTLVGSSSYNPLTPTINQVGYTNAMNPQERPTSVGLSPVDVGQSGTDSAAASFQAAKPLHGPGSADWNSSSPDYTAAGGSTYTPVTGQDAQGRPLHGPGSADWNSNGPDYTAGALTLGAAGVGALTNLKNGADIAQAEKDAAATQAKGYTDALAQNQAQFDTTQANIKPWLDAGKTALPKLESFDTDHPRGDFTASPDYAFRLSEGLKALRNAAGAQGSLVAGETMKAASNYAGNAASQEYGNWYNRQENTRNTDRAALQSLAGLGQTAVGQSNAAGQAFSTNQMAGTTGMANAMAAGTTGAANATASGYQSGAQTLMGGINSAIAMGQNQQQYNALLKLLDKTKAQ